EVRLVVNGEVVEQASVRYAAGEAIGYGLSTGSVIRGKDDTYSLYSRSKQTCSEGGADYDTYRVGISSGRVAASGDLVDIIELNVTVDASGKLTTACAT